jgi:hypothetical protein
MIQGGNASRLWRRESFLKWEYYGPVFPMTGRCCCYCKLQQDTTQTAATTMSTFHSGESSPHPFREPAPLPASIPKVNEVGATSAPLKSAAFFIGAYCKEFNGGCDTYS